MNYAIPLRKTTPKSFSQFYLNTYQIGRDWMKRFGE